MLMRVAAGVCALATLSAAPASRTFTGVITDSECAKGDHSAMRMGDTDAECVLACIDAHGATFVLWDGERTYALTDQRTPATLAAQRVTVTGTLDGKTNTIAVASMVPAK